MFPILVIENKTSTFLKIKKFIILNVVTVPNHNNGSGNVKNVSTILTLQINEDRMKKPKKKKETSPERFELSRGNPMYLAGTRLNHSAKATV